MHEFLSERVKKESLFDSASLGEAVEDAGEVTSTVPPEDRDAAFVGALVWGVTRRRSVPRLYDPGRHPTTFDDSFVYYMDVGGWGRGDTGAAQTTFGLISGRDIYLCDWMNMFGEGKDIALKDAKAATPPERWYEAPSAPIRDFLCEAQEKQRGFVLAAARAPEAGALTEKDQLIVVLPDLHLHLAFKQPLDYFAYRLKDDDPLSSLDPELRSLLDLANRFHATTVQAGDMYEGWESEVVLRTRLNDLTKDIDEWRKEHPGYRVRGDVQHMLDANRVPLARLFSDESWDAWLKRTADRDEYLLEAEIDRDSVVVNETESIQARIRAQHVALFRGGTSIFKHELRGNHDNNRENVYWKSWEDCPPNGKLRVPTRKSGRDGRSDHASLGREQRIWIEHGHIYDWHNNDRDWWDIGHGFALVHLGLRAIDHWATPKWLVRKYRSLAGLGTDLMDCEMRFPELLRADEILSRRRATSAYGQQVPQSVSLVVMGHTHAPCLVEVPRGTSMFWLHPHARQYLKSSSCLGQAKDIALALPEAGPTITSG